MKTTHCQWVESQPPPPLELLDEAFPEPEPLVAVVEAAAAFPAFAQKLLYQLVMVLYAAGLAVHAASHTPAVVDEKADSLASLQKQAS